MARIVEERFPYPQSWSASSFADVEDISFRFSADQLAVIDALARGDRWRDAQVTDIGREDFSHPVLNETLAGLREQLLFGSGIVLLRGLPVEELDAGDMAKIFWGIATHFGFAVSQSTLGERLGHVVDLTKPGSKEKVRGYASASGLRLHNDPAQLLGLLCYRQASSGGISTVANALTIHNHMAERFPEYLPILYRGFRYHRRGQEATSAEPITPYRVPVFSNFEAHLSAYYVREVLEFAADALGESLTDREIAALDCFEALGHEHSFSFRMEPGDALFLNNRTTLHARSDFANGPQVDQQRHLMRLWLDAPGLRPTVPEIQIYENADGHGGIDPQPSRHLAGG